MDTPQKQSLTKKYFLTEEEKTNIESRQMEIKRMQYLMHLINQDIQGYTQYVILKRLDIPEGKNYILSTDNTYITLPGGENEPNTNKSK